MAYYLMAEKKKGTYVPINIKHSKYYQRHTNSFNKPCAHSLQELDEFTMMFNNEIELRERLLEEGTLPFNLFDKPLSIRFSRNEKYTKVPYEFLYQDDIEYILEPTRLIEYIMKKYYENDFLLIKKIANLFSEFRRCSSTAPEVRQLVEASIRDGKRHPYLDTVDENGDKLVARLIKLIILESKDNYKTGRVEYQDKVNYRNLHVLIAFINYYNKEHTNEKKQQQSKIVISKEKEETQIIQQTTSEQSKNESNQPKFVKSKTLGRKKYTLDNQLKLDI